MCLSVCVCVCGADADESSELQGQKGCRVDEEETENKVCESEYAEINDSGLPRYTDIFKEVAGVDHDPFTKATAPPICTYESRAACGMGRGHLDSEGRGHLDSDGLGHPDSERRGHPESNACGDPDESNVKEVLQGTADILERELWLKQQQEPEGTDDDVTADDRDYYNMAGQQVHGRCQGQRAAVVVGEAAVLSLTKDDPAVLTGGTRTSSSSSPPSPTSLPRPNTDSTGCDVDGEADGADPPPPTTTTTSTKSTSEDQGSTCSASTYDSLAERRARDSHQYQPLIRRKAHDDNTQASVAGQDAEEELGFVDDDSAVVINGHAEETADC